MRFRKLAFEEKCSLNSSKWQAISFSNSRKLPAFLLWLFKMAPKRHALLGQKHCGVYYQFQVSSIFLFFNFSNRSYFWCNWQMTHSSFILRCEVSNICRCTGVSFEPFCAFSPTPKTFIRESIFRFFLIRGPKVTTARAKCCVLDDTVFKPRPGFVLFGTKSSLESF